MTPKTDYGFILGLNYQGRKWSLNGDDYAGLVWDDESKKPSQSTLDQQYADYRAKSEYKRLRAAAYSEMEKAGVLPATVADQLDEVWSALESLKITGELSPRAAEIIETRRGIKNKFKKSE